MRASCFTVRTYTHLGVQSNMSVTLDNVIEITWAKKSGQIKPHSKQLRLG